MTPGILDHLTAGIIVVLLPIYGIWEAGFLRRGVAAGRPAARQQAYALTMAVEWVLTAWVLILWWRMDRPAGLIGLGLPLGWRFWIGAGLAVVGSALLIVQNRGLLADRERIAALREQMRPQGALIPRSAAERRGFAGLSVTAGICEEILYRGFLIVYLTGLLGLWPAVALAILAFGLGHAYQGVGGIARTAGVGAVMAGLALLTGSLWAPILLHTALDLSSGYLGYHVFRTSVTLPGTSAADSASGAAAGPANPADTTKSADGETPT